MISRSLTIIVFGVGALLAAVSAPAATTTSVSVVGRPNVVLILVDDARAGDLSTLPVVQQRIGAAGVRFTEAVSSFPLCCPARATLLTGQYPHNHGVLGNVPPLGGWVKFRDTNTLATWLDPAYETALIGKYLNGYEAPYVPPGWDYWATPRGTYQYTHDAWSINGANESLPGYQTHSMGTLAARFIADRAAKQEPFFLFTSIVAPHAGNPAEPDDPPMPTPNVAERYRDTFAGLRNSNPAFNEADVSDKPIQPDPLTRAEITALTEVNAQRREALLSAQDTVTRILNTLSASGEIDNTYIWFLSDNGYIMGEHRLRWGKLAPYDVSVHVPLLLRGPGIAPGTVVRQPTALTDIAPTILAMGGRQAAQGPFPMDGVNLLPRINNPTPPTTRPVLIEAGPRTPSHAAYQYHGIIADLGTRRWKYVVRAGDRTELYDLTRDPAELTNVSERRAFATTRERMQQLLDRYQWCAGLTCR